MTQEEKDLLLRGLCAMLPYGIKFPITWADPITSKPIETTGTISDINRYGIVSFVWDYEGEEILEKNNLHIKEVKPYLFPLSSMTNEQLFEVQEILGKDKIKIEDGFLRIVDSDRNTISYLEILALLKWFYKNHFDVNNLIPMGLAIDCTNLNIY